MWILSYNSGRSKFSILKKNKWLILALIHVAEQNLSMSSIWLEGEKTRQLKVMADLISVKSISKIESEYLFVVHWWCRLNSSENNLQGDLRIVAPKMIWMMTGALGPKILMGKGNAPAISSPELGGPEDADTCWLLGYMHMSNLTENISSCVEIKMCFARWLCNDVCVVGFEVCTCYKDAEIHLHWDEAGVKYFFKCFPEPRHRGNFKFQLVLHAKSFLAGQKFGCGLWPVSLHGSVVLCILSWGWEAKGYPHFPQDLGEGKQESERSQNVTLYLEETPDVKTRTWCLLKGFSPWQKMLMVARLDVPAAYDQNFWWHLDVPSRPKNFNAASGFCVIKFKWELLIVSECQKYFVNSVLQ